MKALRTITLATCLLALGLPATVQAAGGKKKDKDQNLRPGKIVKLYGSDGMIHPGAESDALRKAFETDPRLKYLDTNHDGKLDDSEIAAIKAKQKNGKKKDKGQVLGPGKIVKMYGSNGVIHPGAESDALRKAFETDPRLKYLDTNNDGKLDDSEIAAIKPKHKGGKKKNNV
jgi:hypothetical protein